MGLPFDGDRFWQNGVDGEAGSERSVVNGHVVLLVGCHGWDWVWRSARSDGMIWVNGKVLRSWIFHEIDHDFGMDEALLVCTVFVKIHFVFTCVCVLFLECALL